MIYTKDWLNQVAKKFLLEQDPSKGKKLAEIFGCTPQFISNQMTGKNELSQEQIDKISRYLDIPKILIFTSVNYERCIKQGQQEEAKRWEELFNAHSKDISKEWTNNTKVNNGQTTEKRGKSANLSMENHQLPSITDCRTRKV